MYQQAKRVPSPSAGRSSTNSQTNRKLQFQRKQQETMKTIIVDKDGQDGHDSIDSTKPPAILDGKFYKIVEVDKNDSNKIKAKCLTCIGSKETIISGTVKATTNFKLHMKRKHSEALAEFEKYKESKKTRNNTDNSPSAETNEKQKSKMQQMKLYNPKFQKASAQKRLDSNIVRYIVCSMKPLCTVEDENFTKIITDINQELTVMSRRTLGRKIDDDYSRVTDKLKQILHNIEYISTTADIWSTKHKSFMGVTAHWINKDLDRKSCVLDCRRFKGSHTYDKVAEVLYDITSEYGLKHEQLVSTITDNGSNFVKAFREFGVALNIFPNVDLDSNIEIEDSADSDSDILEFETLCTDVANVNVYEQNSEINSLILPNHLRCASHTLNLLGTTDFNKVMRNAPAVSRVHHTAFGKATTLWNASRKPKSSEIISNLLGCSLVYPCPTRWNSLYDATERLLKFKGLLNELNTQLGFNAFKDVELEYLEEYCILMKPIAMALDSLQREQNCFYGQLLPTLFSVKHHIRNLHLKSLRHVGPIITPLSDCLQTRFQKFFELSVEVNEAILASCFHPMFKLKWLPEEQEHVRKRIQDLCVHAMETDRAISDSSDSETEEEFFVFSPNKTEKKQQSQKEMELISYFNDKGKCLNSLNNYPNIKKLFIRYNTSLCSSAPVERLFSYAGFINSPARGSLSDTSFKKIVCLKGNQEYV